MTTNTANTLLSLSEISVERLFHRFNHKVFFKREENLTIITAPNGFGKTIILKIIHNFLSQKLAFFTILDFENIKLVFSDELGVRISKQTAPDLTKEKKTLWSSEVIIEFLGQNEDEFEPYKYNMQRDEKFYEFIERRHPVHRIGPDKWFDDRTDSYIDTDEVISLYVGSALPSHILGSSHVPDWLTNLFSNADSHLIETQRLLSLELDDARHYSPRRRRMKSETVVKKDAEDLSEKIGRVVNTYATEAQKLDQTFPKRIIENRPDSISEEEDIRAKLKSLSEKRENLFNAGLIGESGAPISSADDLSDENIRRILSIYVSDTDEKLGVFDDIYEKVGLFKNIINEHFMFKEIVIDQINGIVAQDIDSKTGITLSELSSGEQHELVLIYELLFKVKEGSIILIDEPELSLHVGWQNRFISDIQKIQKLRNLQFVIATHSPQIISNQWDLVQELSYRE